MYMYLPTMYVHAKVICEFVQLLKEVEISLAGFSPEIEDTINPRFVVFKGNIRVESKGNTSVAISLPHFRGNSDYSLNGRSGHAVCRLGTVLLHCTYMCIVVYYNYCESQ